jgi:galactokinase
MLPFDASAFAPGRVEILGNHTDYNDGFVLSAALELGTTTTGRRLDEGVLRFSSDAMDGSVDVAIEDGVPLTKRSGDDAWANYLLGVFEQFRASGIAVGGVEVDLRTTLPLGAGLSSSAALTVSFATLLVTLFGAGPEGMALARLCRRVEQQFVGVPCGLLDQATSVFGAAGKLVFLDCGEETVQTVALPEGLAVIVCLSGVEHQVGGGEYQERLSACEAAAAELGVRTLREADSAMLDVAAAQGRGDPSCMRRARHVVDENARVLRGKDLLAEGRVEEFGALMFESHKSSQTYFENSTTELDLLVEIARADDRVLGSKLTGGGFGGATVSLVRAGDADLVSKAIAAEYQDRTGNACNSLPCRIGDGARVIMPAGQAAGRASFVRS